jgi:hypothetical protein
MFEVIDLFAKIEPDHRVTGAVPLRLSFVPEYGQRIAVALRVPAATTNAVSGQIAQAGEIRTDTIPGRRACVALYGFVLNMTAAPSI